MPQISVIVPVYKVEPYLNRCVDSILEQTFSDLELILVDDGSPDSCPAICDTYASSDPRVVVIHQENGGLSAARNAGIEWALDNSNSEWLSFIDSDDWVQPDFLSRLVWAAQNTQSDVSMCYMNIGKVPCSEPIGPDLIYLTEDAYCSGRLHALMPGVCTKLYRKRLWKDIRFPDGKIHEDRFTTHKILFQSQTIAIVQSTLYNYYINTEGITHSAWSPKRLDDLQALKEQCAYFKEINARHAWRKTAMSSMWLITSMIQEIEQSSLSLIDKKKYIRELKYLLRKSIRGCRRINREEINNAWFALETAYPGIMKVYTYAKAILRKLRLTQ